MADHAEESLIEKFADKIRDHDGSSSSSDSDDDKSKPSIKSKINRLFGREQPVHKVLGGGKRKKKCSFLPKFPLYFFFFLNICIYYYYLEMSRLGSIVACDTLRILGLKLRKAKLVFLGFIIFFLFRETLGLIIVILFA